MKVITAKTPLWQPALIILMGVGILLSAIYAKAREAEKSRWPTVDATVVDLKTWEVQRGHKTRAVYEYVVSNTRFQLSQIYSGTPEFIGGIAIGDKEMVQYNPQRFEDARLAGLPRGIVSPVSRLSFYGSRVLIVWGAITVLLGCLVIATIVVARSKKFPALTRFLGNA